MSLVTMNELLRGARTDGVGVGAFNVGNLEMVKGVVQAAEELNTPVILQIAQVRLGHSPLGYMGPMMVQAAREAKVDIAVHLDHGLTEDVIQKALELGFTSVMFDGSGCPLEENIRRSGEIRRLAARYGATMEAELGRVGGSEDGGAGHAALYTDPDEAVRFCRETGVDALAVAIGNAHGHYKKAPCLAFDVLEQIRGRVEVPLVLHGGSGITDSDFQRLIRGGITKVNIATAGFESVTRRAEDHLRSDGPHSFFTLNEAMVEGAYENTRHHIKVFRLDDLEAGGV